MNATTHAKATAQTALGWRHIRGGTPVLLLLGGGGGGRILEKSAQHDHGIAERLPVGGVKALQIRIDGCAAVDAHLPQGVDRLSA